MEAVRGMSGTATVGAIIQDDGTVTVAWTANERPFTRAFIANVPLVLGTQTVRHTGTHPFCGEPEKGSWEAVIGVTTEQVG
jgi:hypothetical protein